MPQILSLVVLLTFVMALPAIAQEQRRMKGEGKKMEMTPPSKEEFLKQMDQTLDKMGKVREKIQKGEASPDARMMRIMQRMTAVCDGMLGVAPKAPDTPRAPPPAEKK